MSKKLTLGIVMDPIESITPYKDTSLAMLLEAQRRGYDIWYCEPEDLFIDSGIAKATMRPLSVCDDNDDWYSLGESNVVGLGALDTILMRVDPPFNMNFVYCTYLLELAEQQGALVVNKPQSLRDFNEKLSIAQFPECCVPTLVTSNIAQLKAFVAEHGDAIIKPLDGMGGKSIFRITEGDANTSVILDTITEQGSLKVMAQRFIPDIVDGDKRILLIDGQPIPYALARIPLAGETRGNLAAGGRGVGQELSARDLAICDHIGPTLKAKGLTFVGIDVIGDHLTEINVTSPTCVRELDTQFNINICSTLFDAIEAKIAAKVAT